jgi:NAD-dependent dihydropyrimidine dehydrogenase PreA subunit
VSARLVLYEGRGTRPLEAERRHTLLVELLEAGHPVTRPAPNGHVAPEDESTVVVLGRFEDARVEDARALDLDAPGETLPRVEEALRSADVPPRPAWTPWFPVIDYQRCTNCMQCLSFCLFDVYGVDGDGKIEVRNEPNCKTNCPACSRVCPDVAILFPKYKRGPINGDVVRAEDVKSEAMKVDVTALLGGDIYASLRGRSQEAKQRFSTERDESKALLERKKCLKELQETLDIPDEVLMTLPSAGEIQERAARARAKHKKRMERSQTVQDRRARPTEEDWGI